LTDRGSLRRAGLVLITVLVAACTAAPVGTAVPGSTVESQPAPSASVGPSPSAPAALIGEADGYTLTVTPDRLAIAPGETVRFAITFRNGTAEPIDYAGPACGGGTTGYVFVPLPTKPAGKSWSGIRQTFKDYVLRNGMGPGIVPASEPLQINISGQPCGEWTIGSELGPGETVTSSMSWKAEIVAGVDALEGPVPFKISVGYDQQNGPPSYPPDYTGPLGSWSPMFKELAVNGELEVIGQGRTLAGPGEIIDAALADRKFSAWLAKRPAKTWSGANLFLTSSPNGEGILPKGPSWELDLFREIGVPRHWAIAFIDPFDAALISVHYCNIPCDR
jgi:hypothetical protein